MRNKDEPMYQIGIAASMCGLHPQTIRMYERQGLITPARTGRRRMFSDADIERIRQIQRLTQEMGVNLAGVEIIMSLLERAEQMRLEMEEEIERVRAEIMAEFRGELRSRALIPMRRIRRRKSPPRTIRLAIRFEADQDGNITDRSR